MTARSTVELSKKVSEKSEVLINTFSAKHKDFDEFFLELIVSAKHSLHVLFEETYGDIYTDNAKVFMKFFDNLKLYYEGGVVDFTDIFDSFFITLMQQVFKLMNPSYEMDENYMQCIGDNINVIRPFADLPQKLSNQIQRSFVAARTFVQALKTGERVSQSLSRIYPTTHCTKSIMKIMHCSKCSGHVTVKPCKNTCLNVLQGCLCDYDDKFNAVWNQYLDTMMNVLDRLEGPFDMESVLSPLDVKISEAIMMLQENKKPISESVFQQCGVPPESNISLAFDLTGLSMMNFGNVRPGFGMSGGNTRDPPLRSENFDLSSFHFYENKQRDLGSESSDISTKVGDDNFDLSGLSNLKFTTNTDTNFKPRRQSGKIRDKRSLDTKEAKKKKKNVARRRRRKKRRRHHRVRDISTSKQSQDYGKFFQKMNEPTRLTNLAKEMKTAQASAKHFWKNLPVDMCDEKSELVAQHNCWNGQTVSKTSEEVISNDSGQGCNSKIYGNASKVPDIAIRQQLVALKEVTAKLWHAHRGIDPAFEDLEIPIANLAVELGSGEGSADDTSKIDKETSLDEQSKHPSKVEKGNVIKKLKDLEESQIKLIKHALGKSVSQRATLKDIKSRILKHPQLQLDNDQNKNLKMGRYGNLTKSEQQILHEIFDITRDSSTDDKDALPTDKNTATDRPIRTTSGASTVTSTTFFILVLCSIAHMFHWVIDQ